MDRLGPKEEAHTSGRGRRDKRILFDLQVHAGCRFMGP
jgi:hypothetical protein